MVWREEREHLQPRGELEDPRGEEPPPARVGVEATVHETADKEDTQHSRGERHAAQLAETVLEDPVDGCRQRCGSCAHSRGNPEREEEDRESQERLRAEHACHGAEHHGDRGPGGVGKILTANGGGVILRINAEGEQNPWEKHLRARHLQKVGDIPEGEVAQAIGELGVTLPTFADVLLRA